MPGGRNSGWAVVATAVTLAGCSRALEPATAAPAPVPPMDSIEVSLFLIGDAGSKAYDGEPVLKDLAKQSDSLRAVKQYVVFLCDNVYPRGVPPLGSPTRDDAERKIRAQVVAIRRGKAQGLLIPGNHDWDRQGRDGWNSIRRMDTVVAKFGGKDVRLLPKGGCPGPEVVDLGAHLRLIVLDSEWWVHNDVKPYGPDAPCPTHTYQEVTDSLRGALRDAGGRHALVLTHHPIRSGGEHGGYFTWSDHIFPLRNVQSWMWLPLPIIGSMYPLARQSGISNQDISGHKYALMRQAFEDAFKDHPPLAMVSGHDHNLQVILGHSSLVRNIEGTLFAREAAGFMRLDVTRDGRVRLSVTTVVPEGTRAKGESAEVYSVWLTQEDGL
jgi:hypothetical protein